MTSGTRSAAPSVRAAAAWARRQEWINGRFVEVDRATGEVLGEHIWCKVDGFIRTYEPVDCDRPERSFDPPRVTDRRVEWRDGRWVDVSPLTGEVLHRMYTQAERKEAVRLFLESGMSTAEVGRKLDIPRNTISSWVRRSRSSGCS